MMMPDSEKKVTISVIVPVYNQQRFVKKCLKSILLQNDIAMEVIVVNDGSTDDSLAIINGIAAQDDRIVVINKANEGVSFARRDGLKIARGEYVCFIDSDDYLPAHALKTLYDTILREDVDVVAGQFIRQMGMIRRKDTVSIDIAEKRISLPQLWDEYYISYFGVNVLPVQMCGKLYKKAIIDRAMSEVSLFSKCVRTMGEDEYFNLMLHPYVKSMYISNAHVYVYRFGGGTSKYNPHLSELYDLSDIRIHLLDQYHYTKGYEPLFIEYKNYIFSDISQRIEYNHEAKAQINSFLHDELGKREVFKRMLSYYNGQNTNDEMKALLAQDSEQIWTLACKRYHAGRKRRWLKKCIQLFFK